MKIDNTSVAIALKRFLKEYGVEKVDFTELVEYMSNNSDIFTAAKSIKQLHNQFILALVDQKTREAMKLLEMLEDENE